MPRVDDDGKTVLLRSALVGEAEFLHDAKRCAIFWHGDGNDAFEMSVFYRVLQCNACGLGCEAAAPLIFHEAPADFYFRSTIKIQRLQTAEADETGLWLEQQFPKTETARVEMILLARDEFVNLIVGPRAAAANIPHHVGISEDRAAFFEVGGRPFGEPEAMGFEMVRHCCAPDLRVNLSSQRW